MSFIILTPDINYIDSIGRITDTSDQAGAQHYLITPVQAIIPEMYDRACSQFIQIIELDNYADEQALHNQVKQLMEKYHITRIIASNEIDIARAARLRQYFQLPGLTISQAEAFTNKHLMKQFLRAYDLTVPAYALIHKPQDLNNFVQHNSLPIIVKPLEGTGCQGIYVIHTLDQLAKYCTNTARFIRPFLAEQYIDGILYNINGIVSDHKIVAVWPSMYWRSPDQLLIGKSASSFLMSASNPVTSKLNDYAHRIIGALPGPSSYTFHLEAFIEAHNPEPVFCEIAARVGGKGVNQSWKAAFNINLKNIDFYIQAGLSCPQITSPLTPEILCAEVWFPQVKGRLIKKADYCPFDWVQHYQSFAILNKYYQTPNNIEDILGGSSLIYGADEAEIITRITIFEAWFYQNHIVDENTN